MVYHINECISIYYSIFNTASVQNFVQVFFSFVFLCLCLIHWCRYKTLFHQICINFLILKWRMAKLLSKVFFCFISVSFPCRVDVQILVPALRCCCCWVFCVLFSSLRQFIHFAYKID